MKETTEFEDVIERLATALTYSEQGEYLKNEAFVREQLQKVRDEERERILRITLTNKNAFMVPNTEIRWLEAIQSKLNQDSSK